MAAAGGVALAPTGPPCVAAVHSLLICLGMVGLAAVDGRRPVLTFTPA
jgi:hypothetical protein